MIVWGWGGKVLNLGNTETRNCETCERLRPFSMLLRYRYWGLYWVFNFVTEKKYLLACDVCQHGWELDSTKVESALKDVPIPFMQRFGLLVFVSGVVMIATIGALTGGR